MTLLKNKTLAWLVLGLMLPAMGCMVSPYDGEVLGYPGDDVSFGGFLLAGREYVEIQAHNPQSGVWEAIGWSRSEAQPRQWKGVQWYAWHAKLKVRGRFWKLEAVPRNIGDRDYIVQSAKVRAVTDEGLMLTIDKNFVEWFDVNSDSPKEMLIEHHHGNSVTIYSKIKDVK